MTGGVKARNARKKETKNTGSIWKKALVALALSIGVGGGLILLFSLLAYLTPDPGKWALPMAVFAAALTYFFGGMIAAKARPDAPLAAGSANGIFLTAVSLLLTLFLHKSAADFPLWATAVFHAGMLLLALAGAAVFSRKGNRNRKKTRRKRHN